MAPKSEAADFMNVQNELQREEMLAYVRDWSSGYDRDHVWAFDQDGNDNSIDDSMNKLFVFITHCRPDIHAYWISYTPEMQQQLQAAGFFSVDVRSPAAAFLAGRTGVAVINCVKKEILFDKETKLLNLCNITNSPSSELLRVSDSEDMRLDLAGKYILNFETYQNQMITPCCSMKQRPGFDGIIQTAMDFRVGHKKYPTLYSFDVFDTLISRKGLEPESIFYAVREQMQESGLFEKEFVEEYVNARRFSEKNVRTYMKRFKESRKTFKTEITFDQIYERMQDVYDLDDEQINVLKGLEITSELDAVIPLNEQIDRVKTLLAAGETVVLISDMYLPKEVIRKMLEKADPVLAEIPLFLSNEFGVLKSDMLLFFEVYRSFKPNYHFGKWIHTGDKKGGDQKQPRKLNIRTRQIEKPQFNAIEEHMTKEFNSHEGFLIAAMQVRMNTEFVFEKAQFVIDYVAPFVVSYVDWAVRNAIRKGFEKLYFVSRDGYFLKLVADALIEENQWPILTKYIYASRRVWRIPSYIEEIDDDFWADYGGNFNDIWSKEEFLQATQIEGEKAFRRFFPQIDLDSIDFSDWSDGQPARKLAAIMKENTDYRSYLLQLAKERRRLVCGYLQQEIDPQEKHAFVEFWGRGYNQECHSRLWNHVLGREVPMYYYYARTAQFSSGNCVRYNMTTNDVQLFYMEAVFGNVPCKSIEQYKEENGVILPVIQQAECDEKLYRAMSLLLPEYAKRYTRLSIKNPIWNSRKVFDYLLDYYQTHKQDAFIYNNFGSLVDSVCLYGKKREFAPPYTEEDIERFKQHVPRAERTTSIAMSYARAKKEVRQEFDEIFQIEPGVDVNAGTWLNEAEIEENRRARILLEKAVLRQNQNALLYQKACIKYEVEEMAVLITVSKTFGDNYYTIQKWFDNYPMMRVQKFTKAEISNINAAEWFALLAKARYVIVDGTVDLLSEIPFRKETLCILIRPNAFWLKWTGMKIQTKLNWKKRYTSFIWNACYDMIEAASECLWSKLKRIHALDPKKTTGFYGSVVTDVYFDADFKKRAYSKLEEVFPERKGKQVILYVPAVAKKANRDAWLDLMDLDLLKEYIGDRYIVAVVANGNAQLLKESYNQINIGGFSKRIRSKMTLRELMIVSDVIVGDFRKNILYESVLLNKPVFFTGTDSDIERTMRHNDHMFDMTELIPFPLISTAKELVDGLAHINEYDYSKLNCFKEKYLSYCDGHSAERLFKKLNEQ